VIPAWYHHLCGLSRALARCARILNNALDDEEVRRRLEEAEVLGEALRALRLADAEFEMMQRAKWRRLLAACASCHHFRRDPLGWEGRCGLWGGRRGPAEVCPDHPALHEVRAALTGVPVPRGGRAL